MYDFIPHHRVAPSGYYFLAEIGKGLAAPTAASSDGILGIITTCSNIMYARVNATFDENNFVISPVSALLVNLISFTANKVEKGVNLSWKVSAEKSFSHYEVERSSNAREFGQIARVNASGKSIYNSLDTKPMNGFNYYRLKMVDLDGTYKYSNLVSINNDTVQFVNLVNPAKGGEVSLTTNIENAKFVVTTTSGKTIPAKVQSLGAGKYKLSMSNTSTGMYIIHAMVAKGNLTRKVIFE